MIMANLRLVVKLIPLLVVAANLSAPVKASEDCTEIFYGLVRNQYTREEFDNRVNSLAGCHYPTNRAKYLNEQDKKDVEFLQQVLKRDLLFCNSEHIEKVLKFARDHKNHKEHIYSFDWNIHDHLHDLLTVCRNHESNGLLINSEDNKTELHNAINLFDFVDSDVNKESWVAEYLINKLNVENLKLKDYVKGKKFEKLFKEQVFDKCQSLIKATDKLQEFITRSDRIYPHTKLDEQQTRWINYRNMCQSISGLREKVHDELKKKVSNLSQ